MKLRAACVLVGFLSLILSLVPLTVAQSTAETASALPRLVRFGGTVKDLNGNPMSGVVGITFALYSEQTGGAALWIETQNVVADGNGHYVVVLGSTKADGLPADLFTSEQARWVGVQVSGQAEQARVLLVSAPYALKAGDAETIGGLPPSAFVLNVPVSSSGGSANNGAMPAAASAPAIANTSSDVTTTGGTVNAIPLWTTATNVQSSALTQTGAGATAKVGIGTITPAATLDVKGTGTIRGTLSLPATGMATASKGFNSQALNLSASAFSSTTSTAVNQVFQWQAEPAGNDTSTPSGTLNLLFGEGATKPSETGLHIANNGQITFATGQLFPGAGTITGITTASGSGLAGGGTSGTLSLNVPAAGITNAMLANSKITLNASTAGGLNTPGAMTLGSAYTIGLKTCSANQILQYSGTVWNCSAAGTGTITGVTTASGSGLSGGGTSGTLSLSVNPAVVPELATANTFTNLQTINAASTTSPALNITNTSGTGIVISAPSTIFGYGLDVAYAGDFGVAVESAGTYGVYANGNYQGGYFNGASGGSYSENDTDSDGAVAAGQAPGGCPGSLGSPPRRASVQILGAAAFLILRQPPTRVGGVGSLSRGGDARRANQCLTAALSLMALAIISTSATAAPETMPTSSEPLPPSPGWIHASALSSVLILTAALKRTPGCVKCLSAIRLT